MSLSRRAQPDFPYRYDFFIAHSGKDRAAAERLFDLLSPLCRVFLDVRSLKLGDDWDQALSQAQRASRVTVVLVSSHTEVAYYQREEMAAAITLARTEAHRVVPVYLEGWPTDGTQVPYGLRLKHSLSLSEAGGLEGTALKLTELLAQMDAEHAAAPVQALAQSNALESVLVSDSPQENFATPDSYLGLSDSVVPFGTSRFTWSLHRLHAEYTTNIQNFLDSYLGTVEHPIPFGGRSKEIETLNNWVNDSSAPSYLLMAAPAARGKSALLVAWAQQLLKREDMCVVFVPISIRFETNLPNVYFSALTAMLATLHGEKSIPSIVDTPAEVWRRMAMNFLSKPLPDGRQLVIILDGADESADVKSLRNLFPVRQSNSVRAVVSARYLAGDNGARPWLVRLGWESPPIQVITMALEVLSVENIAQAMSDAGFPLNELSKNIDVVFELHRLSEGDPLLVRLYMEDLLELKQAAADFLPEDLRKTQPGLDGYLNDYFERWKLDQESLWGSNNPLGLNEVRLTLDILSCAIGPLRIDDIQRLVPEDNKLWSHDITTALHYLNRLVIGDGIKQGYVFTHSLLGDFFYQSLSKHDKEYYESRFNEWGTTTLTALNNGDMAPEDSPPYLTQHFGLHLERANATAEDMLTLVSNGWRRAWEKLSKTYAGFLDDVGRAWKAAEIRDRESVLANGCAPLISQEVRCALCVASVNSLSGRIPPDLLVGLMNEGHFTNDQALAYAYQATNAWRRAQSLIKLSAHLSYERRKETYRAVLAAAWELRDQESDKDEDDPYSTNGWREDGASILEEIAPVLPEDLFEEALATAAAFHNEWQRERAIKCLIPRIPDALVEETLSLILQMENIWSKAQCIAEIAPRLSDVQIEKAAAAVRQTNDRLSWAKGMAGLLPRLSLTAMEDELRFLNRFSLNEQTRLIATLAPGLPKSFVARALQIVRKATDTHALSQALVSLIPLLSESQFEEVVDIATSFRRFADTTVLASVAPHCRVETLRHVFDLAQIGSESFTHENDRSYLLGCLVPLLPDEWLGEARVALLRFRHNYCRLKLLNALGPRLGGDLDPELLNIIDSISDEHQEGYAYENYRGLALEELAPTMPETLLNSALALARKIPKEEAKLDTLIAFLPRLTGELRESTLEFILRSTRSVDDPAWQSRAFKKLASLMAAETFSLLKESLNSACKINVPSKRARHLAELSFALPPPLKNKALQEGLVAARLINDLSRRIQAQAELSPPQSDAEWETLLSEAQSIPAVMERIRILTWLGQFLNEPLRSIALSEALDSMPSFVPFGLKSAQIADIAPQLTTRELYEKALNLLSRLSHYQDRQVTIIALGAHLPWPFIDDFLDFINEIADEESRIKIFAEIGSYLPVSSAEKLIRATTRFRLSSERTAALGSLVKRLTEKELGSLLRETVREGLPREQLKVVNNILPHVEGEIKQELATVGLYAAERLLNGNDSGLSTLIPHLPEYQLDRALTLISSLGNSVGAVDALKAISSRLPLYLVNKGLEIAKSLSPPPTWCEQGLAAMLGQLARVGDAERALSIASNLSDASWRRSALGEVAQHLPLDLIDKGLSVAQELSLGTDRDTVQAALLLRLAELGKPQKAIDMALAVLSRDRRAKVLASAFVRLPKDRRSEILGTVLQEMKKMPQRSYTYDTDQSMSSTDNNRWKADVLSNICSELPASGLRDAISVALEITPAVNRTTALKPLLSRTMEMQPDALHTIVSDCLHFSARLTREQLFTNLQLFAPAIRTLEVSETGHEICEALREVECWWP